MNKSQIENRTLFTGDNLQVMRAMNSESVDLIYLDPPFNKKYVFPIGKGKEAEFGFTDIWGFGKGKDDPYLLETELNAYNELMWAKLFGAPTISKADAETLLEFVKVSGKIGGESAAAYLSFMAVRLLEMKRILKPTGSIYLHCDPTMSHGIKLLMDIVFSEGSFRNEITWKRYRGKRSGAKYKYCAVADSIFFYGMSKNATVNTPFIPLREEYVRKTYKYDDNDGKGRYRYGGRYRERKYYLANSRGIPITSLWDDVHELNGTTAEATGYPTQKPVELLERIIKASSNEDDLILDPFCGCATTCIAAERLGRRWIGIDVAKQAANLVKKRLDDETKAGKFNLVQDGKEYVREKIPQVRHRNFEDTESRFSRTDIDGLRSPDNVIRMQLYGIQGGNCVLCQTHFDHQRHFHLDHKTPKAKGGPDIDANLQLLCAHCNAVKGDRTMAEARKSLQKWGYAA